MELTPTAQAGTGIVAPNLLTNEAQAETPVAETQNTQPETAPIEDAAKPTPRTFTQEELNVLIARESAKSAKLERERLETERKNAEMSEAEKAKATSEQHEKRAQELEGKLKRFTVLEAAQSAASKEKIVFAEGALSDAFALGLLDSVLDENGNVVNAAAAVKELAKARPNWLQVAPRQAPNLDSQSRGTSESIVSEDEEKATLRRLGLA